MYDFDVEKSMHESKYEFENFLLPHDTEEGPKDLDIRDDDLDHIPYQKQDVFDCLDDNSKFSAKDFLSGRFESCQDLGPDIVEVDNESVRREERYHQQLDAQVQRKYHGHEEKPKEAKKIIDSSDRKKRKSRKLMQTQLPSNIRTQ